MGEEKTVAESVQELVSGMVGHMKLDLEVETHTDDPETIRVELTGADAEFMVRNRAEVLDAFQYLTNRIFGRRLEEQRLVVDCDGYRARKEAELVEIAGRVAERVRQSGREEEVGRMNPYERRIVHLAVQEIDGVTSESEGDGVMKRVFIIPA